MRKDVDYQLLKELFQTCIVVHERSAVKNALSTYVYVLYPGRFILVEYVVVPKFLVIALLKGI